MERPLDQDHEVTPAAVAQPGNGIEFEAGQRIADLLVKAGHITAEQLRYATRVQSKLSTARTLISVLQELHFVTAELVQDTLRANALSVPLGALLVELGYLHELDLKTALALQAEKPGRKLGQILIEAHLIKEETLSTCCHFSSVSNTCPRPHSVPIPSSFALRQWFGSAKESAFLLSGGTVRSW